MNNLTTFALRIIHNNEQINMSTMQPESQTQRNETLLSMREKALALVEQVESEELLAEVIGLLCGSSLPCAYSHEQMEESLREAENDFQNGRFVSHSSICERYGV